MGQLESQQFEDIKQVISAQIKNFHIQPEKPLFLATDASQISCGYILFQLSPEGLMQLVKCDSRLLKQSSRNRGASRRELISLSFALIENENLIRNHGGSVLMLSDASSLQLISRGKTSNTVFSEIGCLISSFDNLGCYYCLGSSLFLSDLFSRSFNEVLLKNGSNLSNFCQICQKILAKKF